MNFLNYHGENDIRQFTLFDDRFESNVGSTATRR